MKRHFGRTASQMAAAAFLLSTICITTQPCLAQYTAGHTAAGIKCMYDQQGGVHLAGATNGALEAQEACPQFLQGATMGTIGPEPPMLQRATMGTIGPQGDDASIVVGANTVDHVHVNNLAMVEALLNTLAKGAEIITVLWGSLLMLGTLHYMFKERNGIKRCLLSLGVSLSFLLSGLGIITNALNCAAFALDSPWKQKDKIQLKFWMSLLTIKVGLSLPDFAIWIVEMTRDTNLFA